MTYTLITANRNYSSWSLRPWVLMKALGIPFTDRLEPFAKPDNYAAFRAFSPTGQVPVLIDGERTSPTRWESRFIWPSVIPASGRPMKLPASLPKARLAKCTGGLGICGATAR